MNGQAIAAQPLACAALRQWATEAVGPRPGGVGAQATAATDAESRGVRFAAEQRATAATRP